MAPLTRWTLFSAAPRNRVSRSRSARTSGSAGRRSSARASGSARGPSSAPAAWSHATSPRTYLPPVTPVASSARSSDESLLPLAGRLLPLSMRRLLERVGSVGQPVAMDLPEEDSAEAMLHGPLGLDRDGLGVVVADHSGVLLRDEPGVLGLVVPLAGPARITLQLVEIGVITPREPLLRRPLCRGIRSGDIETAAVQGNPHRQPVRRYSPL